MPLIIAVITIYIAYQQWKTKQLIADQQWKTNQLKLKSDRYDRRLHVYDEVMDILSQLLNDILPGKPKLEMSDFTKFRKSVSEAYFLFESDIPKYISEIFEHGTEYLSWCMQYKEPPPPPPYDHTKVVEEIDKERRWLIAQLDQEAKVKFKRYLDINDLTTV